MNIHASGKICSFAYLESTVVAYRRRYGESASVPAAMLKRHVRALDAPAPTLTTSHSSHPIVLGPQPKFLGPRALLSRMGIPPSDPLHAILERESPRRVLRAIGRGVHFLAASSVLHLLLTEPESPLHGRTGWRCGRAFAGCDTFGAALRAAVPDSVVVSASEASSAC